MVAEATMPGSVRTAPSHAGVVASATMNRTSIHLSTWGPAIRYTPENFLKSAPIAFSLAAWAAFVAGRSWLASGRS